MLGILNDNVIKRCIHIDTVHDQVKYSAGSTPQLPT